MKRKCTFLMLALLIAAPAAARTGSPEEAQVRQAALDYIEGWYEGDAARLEGVLHPEFVRRIAAVTTSDEDFFLGEDRDRRLAQARRGGDAATPAGERDIAVAVLDVARTTAAVRVDSAYYTEYLSLVRMRGLWRVVDVLWENVPSDKIPVRLEPGVRERYTGHYRHDSGFACEILVEGDRLFLDPEHEPRSEYFPASATEFFTRTFKSGLSFVLDPAGEVTGLIIHQRHREYPMARQAD
jgi:hypothetical protein